MTNTTARIVPDTNPPMVVIETELYEPISQERIAVLLARYCRAVKTVEHEVLAMDEADVILESEKNSHNWSRIVES
jgi:hypothetical protein